MASKPIIQGCMAELIATTGRDVATSLSLSLVIQASTWNEMKYIKWHDWTITIRSYLSNNL
jgi:hypothetical protein